MSAIEDWLNALPEWLRSVLFVAVVIAVYVPVFLLVESFDLHVLDRWVDSLRSARLVRRLRRKR